MERQGLGVRSGSRSCWGPRVFYGLLTLQIHPALHPNSGGRYTRKGQSISPSPRGDWRPEIPHTPLFPKSGILRSTWSSYGCKRWWRPSRDTSTIQRNYSDSGDGGRRTWWWNFRRSRPPTHPHPSKGRKGTFPSRKTGPALPWGLECVPGPCPVLCPGSSGVVEPAWSSDRTGLVLVRSCLLRRGGLGFPSNSETPSNPSCLQFWYSGLNGPWSITEPVRVLRETS